MMIKKKNLEEFHIFVIFLAITRIKKNYIKFDTRRFLRSLMLKLEMQKYCKIRIW